MSNASDNEFFKSIERDRYDGWTAQEILMNRELDYNSDDGPTPVEVIAHRSKKHVVRTGPHTIKYTSK
jgi:hypothetical protein